MAIATKDRRRRMKSIEEAADEMAARRSKPVNGDASGWADLLPESTDVPPTVTPPDPDAAAGDVGEEYRPLMPIELLVPSPTNPRKHFDPLYIAGLADSIRQNGIIQPIVCRPRPVVIERGPTKGQHEAYEIVAGECRWRGAKQAECKHVPVRIKVLTDLQVLRIQLVENVQRADLTPVEQAEGYQQLIDQHDYTVDRLAADLGKSKSHVYGLLKLLGLPPKAQEALRDGVLSPTVAGMLARIPNEQLRGKAAAYCLDKAFVAGGGPTVQNVKSHIEREFMVELKQAPFDRKDEQLVPSAGACTRCPKLTGNARDLYPEGRGDMCTDPACYREKCAAWAARLKTEAEAKGLEFLPKAKMTAGFWNYPGTDLGYGGEKEWIDLKEQCWEDPKHRSYKALIGEELAAATVVAQDKKGELHYLVPKKAGLDALRTKIKARVTEPAREKWEIDMRKRQARERKEAERKAEIGRRCLGLAEAAARKCVAGIAGLTTDPVTQLLRHICHGCIGEFWDDLSRQVVRRRNLPKLTKGTGANRDVLERVVDDLAGPDCITFLAELVAARHAFRNAYGGDSKEAKAFWKCLGIDKQAVAKDVEKRKSKKVTSPAQLRTIAGEQHDDEDPDTLSVADLELPAWMWRRLEAAGLPTVGALRAHELQRGKSLAAAIGELPGFGPGDGRQIAEAVRGVLEHIPPKAPAGGDFPTPGDTDGGERWRREVNAPAARASEGERHIKVAGAELAYEIAPLPSGNWAVKYHLAYGLGHSVGVPWMAYLDRPACLAAFLADARKHFSAQSLKRDRSASKSRLAAQKAMWKRLEKPFVEPLPRKARGAAKRKAKAHA